jgi:hypothetical protein
VVAYDHDEDEGPMFNQQLIHALVADRERAVLEDLRRRQLTGDRRVRWVRRPAKPVPSR